jgi:hypothetical protein
VAATHANVSRVSRLDHVVQSLHRLLDRCVIIETVALQNVDVVELETLERLLYSLEDVLGRRHYKRPIKMRDGIVYLTTETMLVHISALVKLSLRRYPRLPRCFSHNTVQLMGGELGLS